MKRTIFLVISTLIMGNLHAQKKIETSQPKLFQKLVVDVGAVPLSTSFGNPQMTSYIFSLGYQVIKRLDVRLNLDLFNVFDKNREVNSSSNYCERLFGLSLGLGYSALKGKGDTFFKNTNLGFVGKFGAGIISESREQESLFFDISARAHISTIPYIGLGINHQMYFSTIEPDLTSLYLAFGIDF